MKFYRNNTSDPVTLYIQGVDIFGNKTLDTSVTNIAGGYSDFIDIGYTNSADIWFKFGNGTLLKSAKITRDKNGFYSVTDQQTGAALCNSGNNPMPGSFDISISDNNVKGHRTYTLDCDYHIMP